MTSQAERSVAQVLDGRALETAQAPLRTRLNTWLHSAVIEDGTPLTERERATLKRDLHDAHLLAALQPDEDQAQERRPGPADQHPSGAQDGPASSAPTLQAQDATPSGSDDPTGGGGFPDASAPTPIQAQEGWRPIESAPRDGTDFLASVPWQRKRHLMVGCYAPDGRFRSWPGRHIYSPDGWRPLPPLPGVDQ